MAPSADMFEMGVKVQVLKRGTMFPMRAAKMHELYTRYGSIENLPESDKTNLEKNFFKKPLADVWNETCAFFQVRDPAQVVRAEKDPKHKMALIFRSYLGQSSGWANQGLPDRKFDYQVWCGPAMGAFNEWVKGSFLEQPLERKVLTVSLNILYGAAVVLRGQALKLQTEHAETLLNHYGLNWQPINEAEMFQLLD
jgi:PfaD family protein